MNENTVYTVAEVAEMTGRSTRTVIRWFEREPGTIVVLDSPEQMYKRRYRTLRIPSAVFQRVMQTKKRIKPALSSSQT